MHVRRNSLYSKLGLQLDHTHSHTHPTDCVTRPLKRSIKIKSNLKYSHVHNFGITLCLKFTGGVKLTRVSKIELS